MDSFTVSQSDWLHELQHRRTWIMSFGGILILIGIFAIAYAVLATLVTVLALAALLIVGGVAEAVHALRHRSGMHLFMYLMEGLFSLVVGMLLLWTPERGAIVLTLLLAAYFILTGMFRIVTSLALRLPAWGWTLVNGVVSLALGIAVWGGWPQTGLWVLGLFIGINLLFSGWARVMLALALRGSHFEPAHA